MIRSTSLARFKETAYRKPPGTRPVTLTCGHTAWYLPPLPTPGAGAYCRVCDAWTTRPPRKNTVASATTRA
jgi:hypothetical protein